MKSSFGRYLPGNSIVHRMNPIFKLVINIVYIVMAFLTDSYITFLMLLVPVIVLYIVATKNISMVVKMFKVPLLIGVFFLFINFYLMKPVDLMNNLTDRFANNSSISSSVTHLKPEDWNIDSVGFNTWGSQTMIFYGKTVTVREVYHVWVWKDYGYYAFSLFAVLRTTTLIIRIYIMILVTTLLTNTTKPILLTKALEDLMFPLKLLFVPTQIIAMIISIALRFIPTLLDEANRIMKAQAARGVDFKNGRLKEKTKSMITLVIPLFVTSFAKADDLANAMETRGYDPYEKRTRYRKMGINWLDIVMAILVIGLLSFVVTCIYVPIPEFTSSSLLYSGY